MNKNNKNLIIFGTGKYAEKVCEHIEDEAIIKYFVDNNKQKVGCFFRGKKIESPNKLLQEDMNKVHILIASTYFYEIQYQLEKDYNMMKDIDFSVAKYSNDDELYGYKSGYISGVPEDYIIIKSIDDIGNVVLDPLSKRVYRIIQKEKISDTKEIIELYNNNPIIQKFVVQTQMMHDKKIIDNEFVLEHKYLPYVTRIYEWNNQQIKDCAYFCLDFLKELINCGFTLKDIHSYNVAFNEGNFIWIDFGSIIKGKTSIGVFYEFVNVYICSYIMLNRNSKFRLYKNGECQYEDVEGYLTENERKIYRDNILLINSLYKENRIDNIIELLRKWVQNLKSHTKYSIWNDYQDETLKKIENPSLWSRKDKTIISMIGNININNVLDVAGNSGAYCFILASKMKNCIICDVNERAIEKAYNKIIKDKINNILPVVGRFGDNIDERFKSDLVMAIALEHHLVFAQQFTFIEIIENLYKLTNKYLLIEFTLPENEFVSKWINEKFDWYTLENFKKAINAKFNIIATEYYEETRILLMCEKK